MANKEKADTRCLEYARQHTVMLLLLILFFGVLVVPRFYEQVSQAQYNKVDGIVKTIYFSQFTPVLSFVEITYTVNNKEYNVRELVHQHLKVGDHVEIFVGKNNKQSIKFQKPSMVVSSILLASYFLILLLCIYKVYYFFMNTK